MKRVALVTAALVAAVAVWGLSLPPRRPLLSSPGWDDGTVAGILHVHSRASDGRGSLDDIAAAAAEAGLRFVVVTDHGDATRTPVPPAYRSGVLVLDAVEISTRGGHYVALGLPAAPYPLAGEAADVVEDVRRLGGFGIAAHPDSPKDGLRWTDWSAPMDGVEVVNPDTSWRVLAFAGGAPAKWLLFKALLAYPMRAPESIASLLSESGALRERWYRLAAQRPVVAVAGADAHAKLALRDGEPGDNRFSVSIPGYAAAFQTLSVHVTPAQPLTGDAAADAAALLSGLRRGHAYVAIDGWATPAAFAFTADAGARTLSAGDEVPAGDPVTLHVRSNAPSSFTTAVWKDGTRLVARQDAAFDLEVGSAPGVYTVDVRRDERPDTPAWVTSNPIYVRARPDSVVRLPAVPVDAGPPLFDGKTTSGWSWEADGSSLAAVEFVSLEAGGRVRLRYGLSGGAAIGQYSAAAVETARGVGGADAVAFSVRAEHPMRISVQVRAEVLGAPPERWEHSVYVDATEQARVVRFDEMTPVGRTHADRAPKPDVRAIMFVVDTTNSKPGVSGRLWFGNVRLATTSR